MVEHQYSNRKDCWYREVCQSDIDCNSCIRFIEMKYLMDNSGIPKHKQQPIPLFPDDIDYPAFTRLKEIKDDIQQFVEDGKNLYICGRYSGNGKTSWSLKLLLKYFDCVWAGNGLRVRGLIVHVPTLLIQLKDFNNPLSNEYKQNLLNADLVVWDEIGGVGMSNYDYSQLLMYIDQRVFNGKSNIYTGNLDTAEGVEKTLGMRLASRVWGASEVVQLKGEDKRK